jgi:general secretion pathway protein K
MRLFPPSPSPARARRASPRSPDASGIALIIVMISVTVLAILAGGFAYSMKVETRLARNSNSETQLEWLGRSGVEYAKWILAEQMRIPGEPYDALNQVWAGGPGGIGTTNSPLMDVQREVTLANGSFTWKIVDLERKANINIAPEPILEQGLKLLGADPSDTTPVVGAILDWIDRDDNVHLQGAENDYYESLSPPYSAKNGPIDDLSELLLIKGITPDIYWGPNSTNHQVAAFQHRQNPVRPPPPGEMAPYPIGLVDLFTPISGGKININTASAAVLQLIPGVDRVVAEAIVAGRDGEDDGSGLLGPYRDVAQAGRMPEVNPLLIRQLQQYCDVRSYTFEVQVDAQVSGYKRQFVAIITRPRGNPRDMQVLSFYWK